MMVLYSPDWTNTGFSFILITVNLFRHSTLTEQGLYLNSLSCYVVYKYRQILPTEEFSCGKVKIAVT